MRGSLAFSGSTTKSKSTAIKNAPSTSKASISKPVAQSKSSKNAAASSKKSSAKAPHKSTPKKAAAIKKPTVGKQQQQKAISDVKTVSKK